MHVFLSACNGFLSLSIYQKLSKRALFDQHSAPYYGVQAAGIRIKILHPYRPRVFFEFFECNAAQIILFELSNWMSDDLIGAMIIH